MRATQCDIPHWKYRFPLTGGVESRKGRSGSLRFSTAHPRPSLRNAAPGSTTWRTREFGSVRVRMVEYSPGYVADHWCSRGPILLVLQGTLTTELENGEVVTVSAGNSYQVGDDTEPHRSSTQEGARLFVVDYGARDGSPSRASPRPAREHHLWHEWRLRGAGTAGAPGHPRDGVHRPVARRPRHGGGANGAPACRAGRNSARPSPAP
jgi:quercetin dioxygenase-like cupin family protein